MKSPYRTLALALSINAVAMYFIMYAMLDTPAHFHFNINRLYMTLMMVAPMAIVMLLLMRSMYSNRRLNAVVMTAAAAVLAASFLLVRTQTPVGDGQFLHSMIPHHSSAILMCERAALTDPEIVALCGKIVRSQRQEIAQMEDILARR